MERETWKFVVVSPRREQRKASEIVEAILCLVHEKWDEVLDGAHFEARTE